MSRFFTALKFLTIFPVPARWAGGEEDMSRCLPFFPLVGILIGGLAAGWTWGLDYLLPPWPTSVLAAVALVGISRALHMDGLSDTADGFLSSRPRDRILEIMRDSHVGLMGVVAIVCILCLKIGALASLSQEIRWQAVLLAPVAGRCALVITVSVLPYARSEGGLGTLFYRGKSRLGGVLAFLFLGLAGWMISGYPGLISAAVSGAVTLLFAVYTFRKIRGATGDTLGAACEIVELVPPLTMTVFPATA